MEKAKTKMAKLGNLAKRIITALVMIPIIVGICYAGFPYVNMLIFVIGALLSWEWSIMVKNKNQPLFAMTYMLATSIAIILGSFSNVVPLKTLVSCFCALVIMLCLVSMFVCLKASKEKYKKLLILGVPYIAIGVSSIAWIYTIAGTSGIIWYMFVIWSVDTGGMLFGKTIKGPKLAPKVSPNKTWSGLIGGMVLSAIVGCAIAYFYGSTQLVNVAIIGAFLAFVAQMGDLVESAIKRHLNIKDSGSIIPGHGGIFDRIDGMIFAAPVFILVLIFFSNFL